MNMNSSAQAYPETRAAALHVAVNAAPSLHTAVNWLLPAHRVLDLELVLDARAEGLVSLNLKGKLTHSITQLTMTLD
jgi:hypothetical protein